MVSLVYSRTNIEHETNLRKVLTVLTANRLFTKFSKCKFWIQRVSFLGHMVLREGITIDPTKVEIFLKWSHPTTVTKVYRSWDLVGYC